MATILKCFKAFYPIIISSNILRPRTWVQKFIKIDQTVWLLSWSHAKKQINIFSFCISKYCKTISLASSAHPTNHILVIWFTSLQTEYIKEFGYPVESHEITTEDGYILTYHRIPHGKTSNSSGGPPVLVQHGIMADSAVWVSVADSLGQHTLQNTIYYTH